MMNVIAIIPARGGSKRFEKKNIAPLQGKPVVGYVIDLARNCGIFSHVVVSTEDPEIAGIAREFGAEVFDRSAEHAGDEAHELDACLEVLDGMDFGEAGPPEYFCVIYPTAMLLEEEDLRGSYDVVRGAEEPCVVMSVSEFNYPPYKALVRDEHGALEMMFPKEGRMRTQTYPDMVASNGTFYWVHAQTLRKNREKGYYQDHLLSYQIPAERAIDIDYPEDLGHVDLLLRLREEERKK